eukprot:1170962-Prymnesium_polylepis.1
MKAADLDGLHKSGKLKSFDRRTTGGQVTNFVRGRRRGIVNGLCPVPLGADEPELGGPVDSEGAILVNPRGGSEHGPTGGRRR